MEDSRLGTAEGQVLDSSYAIVEAPFLEEFCLG